MDSEAALLWCAIRPSGKKVTKGQQKITEKKLAPFFLIL